MLYIVLTLILFVASVLMKCSYWRPTSSTSTASEIFENVRHLSHSPLLNLYQMLNHVYSWRITLSIQITLSKPREKSDEVSSCHRQQWILYVMIFVLSVFLNNFIFLWNMTLSEVNAESAIIFHTPSPFCTFYCYPVFTRRTTRTTFLILFNYNFKNLK